jgi:hypothetical protein
MIYDMVNKYENLDKNKFDKNVNLDEDLMKDKSIDDIGRLVSSKPIKNYSNFQLNKPTHSKSKEKQFKSQIMKSRLRRYNDPEYNELEAVYDVL